MTILYFAYGSCMCPDEIARDVPEYTVVGRAVVRGFRLGFTRYSRHRRGGVADLVPNMDAQTEGVLYRLPIKVLPFLDEREGAPDHYRRDFIAVHTVDGKIHDRVLTYVVVRKASTDFAPHPDYAAPILSGAETYLSPSYTARLREFIERLIDEQEQIRRKKQTDNQRRPSPPAGRRHRRRASRRPRTARV